MSLLNLNINLYKLSQLSNFCFDKQNNSKDAFCLLLDNPEKKIEIKTNSSKTVYSSSYLKKRDLIWDEYIQKFNHRIWNGSILTLEKLTYQNDLLTLYTSECEYKDIIYKLKMGFARNLPIHAFTSIIPISHQGEYAFAVNSGNTLYDSNIIDLFGGSLNLDESPISSYDSIVAFSIRELTEETGFVLNNSRLKILSLNYYQGVFFFIFTIKIDKDLFNKCFKENKEIKSVIWHSHNNPINLKQASNDLKFFLQYAALIDEKDNV